jgi:hypothetical protein
VITDVEMPLITKAAINLPRFGISVVFIRNRNE